MDERILHCIRNVKKQFPNARFIVFGSHARGEALKDSDLDLYVVFPEILEDPFEIIHRIRRAIHEEINLPLDVLVADEKRFEERAALLWTLERITMTDGIVV